MRSPALAIAWELWGRHRAGIAAFCSALVGLSLMCALLPQGAAREPIFPLSVILFALASIYLASIVTLCEYREGTVTSGYPSRMFTLPVRSRTLAIWPMLYGAMSLALLWSAVVLLVWLPSGIEPAWWLLPLLIVALAWLQAICWAISGSTLIKILAACLVFPALKAMLELIATAVALYVDPHSRLDRAAFVESRVSILALFCGCFLPLAYVVAVWGVARDRRGASLQGIKFAGLVERVLEWLPQRRTRFSSAAKAQFCLEWRCKGFLLPLFPTCFLLFATVVVAPFVNVHQLLPLLAFLCAAVPFVGFFVGYGVGKPGFWADDLGLSSWQATLPLNSDALAAAKLKMAALSALATVGLLFVGIPVWLALLGRLAGTAELMQPYFQQFSAPEVCALGLISFGGLWAMTWGQLAGGLALSLTGRAWVVNAAVASYMLVVTALALAVRWAGAHAAELEKIWPLLAWCLSGLAGAKLLAVAWLLHRLHRQKMLNLSCLRLGIGLWLLGASCLIILIAWLRPATGQSLADVSTNSGSVPTTIVALALILALPLVRPVAAPLALAWNRHR